jgi:hypothetical protein
VATEPPESAQDVGDVGAEHTAQDMEFVDHDIAEAHEKGIPCRVAGEKTPVQHLRIGEDDIRVLAGPRLFVSSGIAVVGSGDQVRERE